MVNDNENIISILLYSISLVVVSDLKGEQIEEKSEDDRKEIEENDDNI